MEIACFEIHVETRMLTQDAFQQEFRRSGADVRLFEGSALAGSLITHVDQTIYWNRVRSRVGRRQAVDFRVGVRCKPMNVARPGSLSLQIEITPKTNVLASTGRQGGAHLVDRHSVQSDIQMRGRILAEVEHLGTSREMAIEQVRLE